MPIAERTLVDIREEMALCALRRGAMVTEIAEQFGVSRPTVRLWRDRYRAEGRAGLNDRSHAPLNCPHRTSAAIEELIVKERERWGWGSKKLLVRLQEKHPELEFPPRSTVDAILSRRGLIKERRPQRRPSGPRSMAARYEATEPSELTTIDYKGQFRLRDGRYCFPLTLMDSVSRYLLACEALPSTSFSLAWPVIERVFRWYGLPKAMQSDNGPPFGIAHGRYSTMSVRLMSIGIQPVFSRPAKPQDNGRHERMHRELKAYLVAHRGYNERQQQRMFNEFRRIYNHERPHEAIDQKRPASRFELSPRPYPRKPRQPQYEAHWEKRKVTPNGMLRWHSTECFLSQAFVGQTIALEPIDVDLWNVRFHEFIVATFDERNCKINF